MSKNTSPMLCASNPFREYPQKICNLSVSKKLVCFDWDGTLSIGNSYNDAIDDGLMPYRETAGLIADGMQSEPFKKNELYDPGRINAFIEEYYFDKDKTFNGAESILENISKLIEGEVNVAIVSYNKFPEIIEYGLKKIGFSPEQILKIHIICGFPAGDYIKVGKTEHIEKAKELCEVEDNKNVILVEDSKMNIAIAKKLGIKCYHVTADTSSMFMEDVVEMVRCKEKGHLPEVFLNLHTESFSLNEKEALPVNKNSINNNMLSKIGIGSLLSPQPSVDDELKSEDTDQALSSGSDLIFPMWEEVQTVAPVKEISGEEGDIPSDFG